MATKKANIMVFEEVNKPFKPVTVAIPPLQDHEIEVKIVYTTICTSDLHTYFGRRSSPCPSVLGHEIIGRISMMKTPNRIDFFGNPLKIGDLITWPIYAYNEDDVMARRGMPQKSASLYKYGHQSLSNGDTLNGGFASHCILKKGTAIYKLSEKISLKEAAPLNCTHATIAGALRLAGDLTGKNVLIMGAGMLGLSACAMAKGRNAGKVMACDTNQDRLIWAKRFGADCVFSANETKVDLVERLEPLGLVDVVIDTTGVPEAMEKGLALLNIGGIAVWVGAVYKQDYTKLDAEAVVRKLLTIKGLHNYIPDDLAVAITFLEKTHLKYPFEVLVEKEYPLKDLEKGFNDAQEGGCYRVGIRQEKV